MLSFLRPDPLAGFAVAATILVVIPGPSLVLVIGRAPGLTGGLSMIGLGVGLAVTGRAE